MYYYQLQNNTKPLLSSLRSKLLFQAESFLCTNCQRSSMVFRIVPRRVVQHATTPTTRLNTFNSRLSFIKQLKPHYPSKTKVKMADTTSDEDREVRHFALFLTTSHW
jgi:hypothetical protein